MTISYNWLSEYLPITLEPEKLSEILTSIGLEVESMEKSDSIPGGLNGLVVGEVMTCVKHPDSDKLQLTIVNVGLPEHLNIVCGASNVAAGQKVIVAQIGTTIYPSSGEPIHIKKAKIRGVESQGMICAEDEIGVSDDHGGIIVLSEETIVGTTAKELYQPELDYIYEIGLTPNRMDAMSHLGVAKDVCAYLSYHHKETFSVKLPYKNELVSDDTASNVEVVIENTDACMRYSGVSILGVTIEDSPDWLLKRIKSIGLKPINNIVDITNFILHETGQPLHAFDLDKITGNKVIVKTAVENTLFKTLDEKERKLLATDLMICNEVEPMCIAGVFGGAESGIKNNTQNIFLESACFDKQSIRKTALKHDLRTDASARFEKGVDISNTLVVLKRAAQLINEIAGGKISGHPIDIYPNQQPKTVIDFEFNFLKKLSGKKYEASDVKAILLALGFELLEETESQLKLAVPYSKPDISIQADVVEEIMRIDGLDNIDIPSTITISPSIEKNNRPFILKEKLANTFVGMGFFEIFTNSITNSAFYSEEQLKSGVKMINSLTSELDMLRLEMLPSGLQVIAHNINRKNHQLRLFEFGKTYFNNGENKYQEKNNLVIYVSAAVETNNWQKIEQPADFYYLKSVVEQVLKISEVKKISTQQIQHPDWKYGVELLIGKNKIGSIGEVSSATLKRFDVKHPVYFAEIDIDYIYSMKNKSVQYKELPKFPTVQRDLAVVVNKAITYAQLEKVASAQQIQQLTSISLFDIFESEKLGADKKSMALSFTFLDDTKTLTDKEIDVFTQKIMDGFEKQLQAEIRK